jgi:DNA-binding PadR family transcriptional regulator
MRKAKPQIRIRPTRRTKHVLSVLLTGATNLDGLLIMQLAGTTGFGAYTVIDRLEEAGWITGEWDQYMAPPRRRYYKLTRQGRAKAIGLLKLEMPE